MQDRQATADRIITVWPRLDAVFCACLAWTWDSGGLMQPEALAALAKYQREGYGAATVIFVQSLRTWAELSAHDDACERC